MIDKGPENKGFVKTFIKLYRVKRVVVSAYYPKANSIVKRGHKLVIDILFKMTNRGDRD